MVKSNAKNSIGKAKPSNKKCTDLSSIIEDEFGNYRIRAGRLSGNFVARAFPKTSANSQGIVSEATGASEDDAIAALKALLVERETRRSAERRWDERSQISVPCKEEFVEALLQTKLSEPQLAMLRAQAIAGHQGLTSTALMNAAGYKSQDMAIKTFERAGALIGEFLGVKIASDTGIALYVLGCRQGSGQDATNVWIMHEELRQAVQETHF